MASLFQPHINVCLAVEPFARTQEEFFNKDILNEQLPQPGEPGAPCLPSQLMPYLILNGEYQ